MVPQHFTPSRKIQALQISGFSPADVGNRWEAIDERIHAIAETQRENPLAAVGVASAGDWEAVAADFSLEVPRSTSWSFLLPLTPVVYHDCLVMPAHLSGSRTKAEGDENLFLTALINLATVQYGRWYFSNPLENDTERVTAIRQRRIAMHAVLSPLHRLTFSAFLTAHRF